ncbi:MAG: MCE family protein [Aeromicrobium erythreum]
MARTSLAERPSSLRILGIGFVALMLFFVWLTYAFFNKTFVKTDDVTVLTSNAGQNLPKNADVKLRGMIVGEVKDIEPSASGKGVKITIGMDPKLIDKVPQGVSAQIIPKTLFGEKYIALIAPQQLDGEHLRAGDTIRKADVPIEVESLLNDLYPLLNAVDPAELSYTLTAVSQALDGRGEKLGKTLVQANEYLKQIDPDVPALVDDLVALGKVSDGYAAQMPKIGRLLENTTFTGNTIVAKRTQLAAFFDDATRLSNTLTAFTRDNRESLVGLADKNARILGTASQYASTFPCFLQAMDAVIPRLDSVFRGREVHIDLKTLADQPTGYKPNENATVPSQKVIDSVEQANPKNHQRKTVQATDPNGPAGATKPVSVPVGLGAVCDDLYAYGRGQDPMKGLIYPGPSAQVYKLVGVKSTHNGKFGDDETIFERTTVASLQKAGFFDASLSAVDTPAQRQMLNRIVASQTGVKASKVPDVASLLISPVVRGSEVSVR